MCQIQNVPIGADDAPGRGHGDSAGVLLVPLLTKLFRIDKDDARARSLAILLPPVSIGAVLKYQAHGDIKWTVVLIGFVSYFISNYWGAKLGRAHSSRRFNSSMGIILILMGILYAWRSIRLF